MPNPSHGHPRQSLLTASFERPSLHHPYKQEFLPFMIPLTFISTVPNPYRHGVSPCSKLPLFAGTANSSCQSCTFSPDLTPLLLLTQALVLQPCQSTRRSQHWARSPSSCLWKHESDAVGAGWCWKSSVWPTNTFQWRPSSRSWVFCTANPFTRDNCKPALKPFGENDGPYKVIFRFCPKLLENLIPFSPQALVTSPSLVLLVESEPAFYQMHQ